VETQGRTRDITVGYRHRRACVDMLMAVEQDMNRRVG
jgi:hypothetical protein